MTSSPPKIRVAVASDLPHIVRMLSDDELGALRENFSEPLPRSYQSAFDAIEKDENNQLIVCEGQCDAVVAVLQLTFTPHITHQGGWRATIEGVRVARDCRGSGLGRELITWAISLAQERGCHLIQLTTDKQRPEALLFYESLGFVASHVGMKLKLSEISPSVT